MRCVAKIIDDSDRVDKHGQLGIWDAQAPVEEVADEAEDEDCLGTAMC